MRYGDEEVVGECRGVGVMRGYDLEGGRGEEVYI
jgi:hypothetical protein